MQPCFKPDGTGTRVLVKVQPRASKNQVCGMLGDALKIKLTAPPVDSAANEALLRFIAEVLRCSPSAVRLVRGETSRNKVISIQGFTPSQVALLVFPP